MKVAACASYITVTASFSTEIQPVRKIPPKIEREKMQQQTKQKILSMLSMHYLIEFSDRSSI